MFVMVMVMIVIVVMIAAVVMAEVVKLLASLLLVYKQEGSVQVSILGWW